MRGKILYIATVAKKHICQFHIPYLKWFREQGYTVHVAAKDDFETGEQCSIPYCDKFYNIPFSRSPFSKDNLKAYHQLRKIISKNGYTLIHCHTPVAAAVGRLAVPKKLQKNTVVLYTTHGFHFFKGAPKSSRLYYLAEKFLIPYTNGIITINQEDFQAAQKLCQNKKCDVYLVHGMGVDTEKYANADVDSFELKHKLNIPPEAFVLLSVCEINANKNLKTTLQAFAKQGDPTMYYVICGTGELLEECRELAKTLGIAERVKFTGYRYDIHEIVHIADVFLFPSHREGLGFAPIEAMSAGVPIIASDIRGVREYAVNMENSILLSPDDVDRFAEAITTLAEDHELRERMSINAKKSVKPFDLKLSLRSMEQIYGKYIEVDVKENKTAVML